MQMIFYAWNPGDFEICQLLSLFILKKFVEMVLWLDFTYDWRIATKSLSQNILHRMKFIEL